MCGDVGAYRGSERVYTYVYVWEGLGGHLFVFHGCLFWWLRFLMIRGKQLCVSPAASTGVINVKKLRFIVLRHSPREIFLLCVIPMGLRARDFRNACDLYEVNQKYSVSAELKTSLCT